MSWRPELIILVIFSTAANYILSHKIYDCKDEKRRKDYLILSIVANFGLLFIFKYLMFASDSFRAIFEAVGFIYPVREFDIILPVGISFYTFQAAAYTIDVYKGIVKPVKSYGVFSLFITFFPQLVAGPIERSKKFLPQFYEKHSFDIKRTISGLKIMLWGFFKKVVIADRAAVAVDSVFNNLEYYSGLSLIVALLFFTFQIYCDFSGYSDIAIGSAKVLGFRLTRNFERPFLSLNVKEFWSRWHVSLSSWFMDYVYIPLGGNRSGRVKQYRNLILTFLVSGLWHGANWTFVIWGGMHGLIIAMENITGGLRYKIKRLLGYEKNIISTAVINFFSVCMTFFLILLTFIFFRSNTISDALYVTSHLAWGFRQWTEPQYLYNMITGFGINIHEFYIIVTSIFILMGVEICGGIDVHKRLLKINGILRTILYAIIASLILIWGVFYNAGAFIYFQF